MRRIAQVDIARGRAVSLEAADGFVSLADGVEGRRAHGWVVDGAARGRAVEVYTAGVWSGAAEGRASGSRAWLGTEGELVWEEPAEGLVQVVGVADGAGGLVWGAGGAEVGRRIGGLVRVVEDLTVTEGVEVVEGGGWVVSDGVVLTVVGEVVAGHYQVFFGDGEVVFGEQYPGETKPAWFGDIRGDAGACINAWHRAVNSCGTEQRNSRPGVLPGGVLPVLTAIDLQDEGGDNVMRLELRGVGGIGLDSSVEMHRADLTVLDCSELGAGEDGVTVGTQATLPAYPGLIGVVCLKGLCVYGAPRDGLIVAAAGSRLVLDDVEVNGAGRHGFVIQDPYGGYWPRIQAQKCGGSGVRLSTANAVLAGMLIVRECGSASVAGSYPAVVVEGGGGSSIGVLYVESNLSSAGKFFGNVGLHVGAIYGENNNAGTGGQPDANKVWHLLCGSADTVCSLVVGQMNVGADVQSGAGGYWLVESDAASYYAGMVVLAWTGSGGLSGDWLVTDGKVRVEIHQAQGLTYDLSASGGDSGLVLVSPRETPFGSKFTLGSAAPVIEVMGAVNSVDGLVGYVEVSGNTVLKGHERVVLVDASGGAVALDVKKLRSNRMSPVVVVVVDNSGNGVTVSDGDGVAVRGVSSVTARGAMIELRYLQSSVESVWYGR